MNYFFPMLAFDPSTIKRIACKHCHCDSSKLRNEWLVPFPNKKSWIFKEEVQLPGRAHQFGCPRYLEANLAQAFCIALKYLDHQSEIIMETWGENEKPARRQVSGREISLFKP
jgi:hypothetical protein